MPDQTMPAPVTGTDPSSNGQATDAQDGQNDCGEGKEFSPFFYARSIVDRPCTTCSCCCGFLVLCLFVLGGLVGAGIEVIRFTSDVPFYFYDSTVYKRETSLLSAFDVAKVRLNGALREREEADSDYELKVIYELDGGETMFTPEILAGIQAMEENVVAAAQYVNFCALNYEIDPTNPICLRQNSPVSFFDPEWWVPVTDPPPQPTVPSAFNTELLLNQSKVSAFDRDNYYAFADPQDPDATSGVVLTQDNVDVVVQYWAGYCSSADECPAFANGDSSPFAMLVNGNNVTANNQLGVLVDTEFGIKDSEVVATATALRSVFFFGRPQVDDDTGELFELDTEGIDEQTEELGTFLYDDIEPILEEGVDGVNVYWSGNGNGMLDVYTNLVLAQDTTFLIYSILFIVLYLVFQLRSWWLGGIGLLMILANFAPSLIIYRVVSGYSYFGTLNALSIFLVLGIGADDIFLFINTWNSIHATEPDWTILEQLTHTLSRGGKAMLVTSLTTAISFLMNASSAFPAVQSFGIFSAVLILTNFCTVITLYPAVTMVYEYYMNDAGDEKGCCKSTCHCLKSEKGYTRASGVMDAAGHAEPEGLARFFNKRLYPFVHKFRVPLLVIFAGILAFFAVVGSQLEADSDAPQLLPEEDQYVVVRDKITEYFSHSDTTDLIRAEIPFGIQGVDRDDCDGDDCDPTIDTDYGAPIWDENIVEISNEYTQKWFLDFCEAVRSADGASDKRMVYQADESVPTPVECVFEGMKTWCDQGAGRCSQTHPTLGTDEYMVDAEEFEETMVTFLNDSVPTTSAGIFASEATNYDVWGDQIRAELTDEASNTITLRYMTVRVLLSARFELEYEKGIDLYNDWGDFLDEWVAKAGTDEYLGADVAVRSGFVTDSGMFHWFFLQEQIIQEAFQSIFLSLFFAFIIMCIATSNWIVSALATFTITAMVGGVIAFTVANGWKLGVLEAVLFVMVVGFSVDYTIHLSDSYLESESAKRADRVRDMLTNMGPSVLSGAISTLGTTLPLLFAYLTFFEKFGAVIFFIIAQSLVFSLMFYSAILDLVGPEERVWGEKIKPGLHVTVKHGISGVAHGTTTGAAKNEAEDVRHGKVTKVDGEVCTVTLEAESCHRDASKVVLPTSSCRGRYEIGHLRWVDVCCEAFVAFLKKCFRKSTV
eukprot:g16640.t1